MRVLGELQLHVGTQHSAVGSQCCTGAPTPTPCTHTVTVHPPRHHAPPPPPPATSSTHGPLLPNPCASGRDVTRCHGDAAASLRCCAPQPRDFRGGSGTGRGYPRLRGVQEWQQLTQPPPVGAARWGMWLSCLGVRGQWAQLRAAMGISSACSHHVCHRPAVIAARAAHRHPQLSVSAGWHTGGSQSPLHGGYGAARRVRCCTAALCPSCHLQANSSHQKSSPWLEKQTACGTPAVAWPGVGDRDRDGAQPSPWGCSPVLEAWQHSHQRRGLRRSCPLR